MDNSWGQMTQALIDMGWIPPWVNVATSPPTPGLYLTWPDNRELWWQGHLMGGTDGREPFKWYDDEDQECRPTHWTLSPKSTHRHIGDCSWIAPSSRTASAPSPTSCMR